MKNINYISKIKLTPWRKISIGSWKPKGDSSIYVFEDFIVDDVLIFCEKYNISLNSFIIKALSLTIDKHKRINSTIRFGNIYEREANSIFVHVLPEQNDDDLTGIIINEAYKKNILDIDLEFKEKVNGVKKGNDRFMKSKKSFRYIPGFFSKYLMDFLSFIMYSLNIYNSYFPSVKDPFGSIMLTNLGILDVEKALCPIAPYTRIPMVVSVGKISLRPIIIDEEVDKAKVSTFGFTFDHRIMDGIHFSKFIKTLRSYFKSPDLIINDVL